MRAGPYAGRKVLLSRSEELAGAGCQSRPDVMPSMLVRRILAFWNCAAKTGAPHPAPPVLFLTATEVKEVDRSLGRKPRR